MRERRQFPADLRNTLRIDVADHDAGALLQLSDDRAPRIDKYAVTVGPAAVRMNAPLCGRQHIALIFYGARFQQDMPVRGTGHCGERRGHDDQDRVAIGAIKLRETQVVAHRKPGPAARCVEPDRAGPGLDGPAFVVVLATLVESKQVHLVVAGDAASSGVENQRCASHSLRVLDFDGNRTADYPDAMLAREPLEEVLLRPLPVGLADRDLVARSGAKNAEVLGQQDELCAATGSIGHQGFNAGQIYRDVAARDGLHRGNAKDLGGHYLTVPADPASVAAVLAMRSTVGSDQRPATAYS